MPCATLENVHWKEKGYRKLLLRSQGGVKEKEKDCTLSVIEIYSCICRQTLSCHQNKANTLWQVRFPGTFMAAALTSSAHHTGSLFVRGQYQRTSSVPPVSGAAAKRRELRLHVSLCALKNYLAPQTGAYGWRGVCHIAYSYLALLRAPLSFDQLFSDSD